MAFKPISVDDLKIMLEAGSPSIVDIRDQRSYLSGHIDNAIHLHQDNMDEV